MASLEIRSVTDIIKETDKKKGENGLRLSEKVEIMQGPEAEAKNPLVRLIFFDSEEEKLPDNGSDKVNLEVAAEIEKACMKLRFAEKSETATSFLCANDMKKTKEFQLVDKTSQAFLGTFGNCRTPAVALTEDGNDDIRFPMIATIEDNGVCFHGMGERNGFLSQ